VRMVSDMAGCRFMILMIPAPSPVNRPRNARGEGLGIIR